jgi:anthranilate phosphoribosyltransferase
MTSAATPVAQAANTATPIATVVPIVVPAIVRSAFELLLNKQSLSHEQMTQVMQHIMQGDVPQTLLAGLVTALRMKGETIEELTAAAQVMRAFAIPIDSSVKKLVDVVGTGGDGARTFNISTTALFVVAAAGVAVAKHGGRSVSSQSGSADVLEALGLDLQQTPQQVAHSIAQAGIGFMFAPNYHPAMKYAAPVRRELGVRTLFNLLGPLTNPARAPFQLLGVFDQSWVRPLCAVLKALGSQRAMVVHGLSPAGALDEIALDGATVVAELTADGRIVEYRITPEDFGLVTRPTAQVQAALAVNNVAESKQKLLAVLDPEQRDETVQICREIVILNAAAALYIADAAPDLKQAVVLAQAALHHGQAAAKLQQWLSCELI